MIITKTISVIMAIAATTGAFAGERENLLIDKIVAAYGGDALVAMKTLKIETEYKTPNIGQSASPDLLDLGVLKDRVVIDFENMRVSEVSWTMTSNGPRLGERYNNGETGHSINFFRGTHVDREDYTFDRVAGGSMRMLDAAIVRVLNQARDKTVFAGTASVKGRRHYQLTFPMPATSDLTIFVDTETNLLSKMTRPGGLSYVYSQHKIMEGVTYASSADFFIDGQPNMISVSRGLTINPNVAGEFEMPEGIVTIPGGMLDTSELMAKEIASGVYLAGQRAGFSIFVDAGDYFIAAGGYPQITKRFEAVKGLAGVDKPLKFQVVTHHHSDHLAGLDEIMHLGADLVVVESHVGAVRAALKTEVEDNRIVLVAGEKSLAGGKVQVFDIATSHSDQFLVFYVPEAKILFSADHFSTQVKNAPPGPSFGAVTFLQALEKLDLDIDYLYDAHTSHVFTMQDLRTVAAKYTGQMCLRGHDICAEK